MGFMNRRKMVKLLFVFNIINGHENIKYNFQIVIFVKHVRKLHLIPDDLFVQIN